MAGLTHTKLFPYFVSVLMDLIRRKLIEGRQSFTFETVMSFYDKVELLSLARQQGYRTYLYFVATDDPEINIGRVRQRVKMHGHPVPEGKIRERYTRSLSYLLDAIRRANRAFIFDNSGPTSELFAEISDKPNPAAGKSVDLKVEVLPAWFYQSVIAKLAPTEP